MSADSKPALKAYDPDDPYSWSEEHRRLDREAWLGLVDGDLDPLVAYLRSPYPVSRRMREDLVRCIQGDGTLHQIVTRNCGGRRGTKSVRREIQNCALNFAIAGFVECLIDTDAGDEAIPPVKSTAAEMYAVELFGVSLAKVQAARLNYREGTGLPTFALAGWTKLQEQKQGR